MKAPSTNSPTRPDLLPLASTSPQPRTCSPARPWTCSASDLLPYSALDPLPLASASLGLGPGPLGPAPLLSLEPATAVPCSPWPQTYSNHPLLPRPRTACLSPYCHRPQLARTPRAWGFPLRMKYARGPPPLREAKHISQLLLDSTSASYDLRL